MPRRRIFGQREGQQDARYQDKLVAKFINTLMSRGKKSTAERVCYGAFELIKEKTGNDPLKVFRAAVDNVKPVVEVKSRRVGGASYQVPVEIRPVRRMSLALRWRGREPPPSRNEPAETTPSMIFFGATVHVTRQPG